MGYMKDLLGRRLDARVVQGDADQGQALVAALEAGGGSDINIAVAGDSTGDATGEHVYQLAQMLAAKYPAIAVKVKNWNSATDAYFVSDLLISSGAGIQCAETITRRDTFHRTASDIIGTNTETGATAWTAGGGDASTDWTADGVSAVASADTLRAPTLVSTGSVGSGRTKWVYQIVSGAAHTTDFLARRSNASNLLRVSIAIDAVGKATVSLVKVVSSTTTTLDALPAADMPTDQTYTVTVTCIVNSDGTCLVGAEVNGKMLTALLSSSDWTAVNGGFNQGIYVPSGSPTGNRWRLFQFGTLAASSTAYLTQRTLYIWNASKPGSTLDYQSARLTTCYPNATAFSTLLVSSSHNETTMAADTYAAKVQTFIDAYRANHPETLAVLLCSQNVEYDPYPDANQQGHRLRGVALKALAAQRRYGYLPVVEKWPGVSFVQSDGLHPTNTGGGDGSQAWARVEFEYLMQYATA